MQIECNKCGHTETINKHFFVKVLGGGMAGFGFWAWVTFIFAGTGFALAICIAIVTGGVAIAAFSNEITEWACKRFACPTCGRKVWSAR